MKRQRGFTLVELMTVVGLIGILSSVAIPHYLRLGLRARKSERDMIMTGVARGVQSILVRHGKFPDPFVGAWNPAGPPGAARRPMDLAAPHWRDMDMQVEGPVYHSYYFRGDETTVPPQLTVMAQGDLDADGQFAARTVMYDRMDNALLLQTAVADDESIY